MLLFCWIGIPQALADIVPVSSSQQVSVSGYVTACDPGCQLGYGIQGDNGNSFSSASTNTNYLSGTASDSVQYPVYPYNFRSAEVDASAGQTFTSTPTNFNLGLSVNDDFWGSSSLMYGTAQANSQYSLVFNLSNPFLVHLTGDINGANSSLGFDPYDSFDGEIHLTGPGFQFDQGSDQGSSTAQFGPFPFDASFTLGPGQYTLDAVAGLGSQQGYDLDSNSFLDVSLNADFTPAIPEPARVSTVLGVLMVVGLFFARTHGVQANS
ncbi:MAG: hypothetical protein ABSE86_39140 [Bryobacteraceae bacterium]